MINGVSLSQLDDVNLTKVNHYRRISQVEHSRYTRFSVLDPELAKIFQNRKLNHVLLTTFRNDGRSSTIAVLINLGRVYNRNRKM